MSSHQTARENKSRPIDVTLFDPETTYASFLINDAIILAKGEVVPGDWHTNDCPQADMYLYVCGRRNWLYPTLPSSLLALWASTEGPSTDHRRSVSVLSEARENLSTVSVYESAVSFSRCSPWHATTSFTAYLSLVRTTTRGRKR